MFFKKLVLAVLFLSLYVVTHSALAQTGYPSLPVQWDQASARYDHADEYAQGFATQSRGIQPSPDYFIDPYAHQPVPQYAPKPIYQPIARHMMTAPMMHQPMAQHISPVSAIEAMYARRIVDPVEQFGYDLFGIPSAETRRVLSGAVRESFSVPSGTVRDDFILSIGDQLEIVFTGQRHDRAVYEISNTGALFIKDFPPIPAAGRSIGQLRISIDAAARNLHNTQAHVSLATVRQIGVLVVGHVRRPGRQNLTVFHTVLDALMEAGGIDKSGSLRQVRLIRDGRTTMIDLYGLLLHGGAEADMNLQDGDRIAVPPLGPTVAIAGEVKRAGIYEILPRLNGMRHDAQNASEKLSLNDMLEFAGGVLVSGQNRFMRLSMQSDGQENAADVTEPYTPLFADGSILVVSKGREKRAGTVELKGHTRKPGIYAIDEIKTLSDLLPNGTVLGDDIYPLIGVIERWDGQRLARHYQDFSLRLVLSGQYDDALQEDDIVHLFSNAQIRALHNKAPQNNAGHHEEYGGALALNADQTGDAKRNNFMARAAYIGEQGSSVGAQRQDFGGAGFAGDGFMQAAAYRQNAAAPRPPMIDDPVLAAFLRERAAFIRGAVRHSGAFPVAQGTTLDSVLAVAGGLALEANTGNIEITATQRKIDLDISPATNDADTGLGENLSGDLSGGLNADLNNAPETLIAETLTSEAYSIAETNAAPSIFRYTVNLNQTNPKDIVIGPGDSVRVNQKFDKIRDRSVMILGEVRNPGRYDLIPGDKVSDLITRAGGLNIDAYPQGSIFSRESERRAEENRYRAAARDLERALAMTIENQSTSGQGPNTTQIVMARGLAEELRSVEAVGRIIAETDPGILRANPELDMLLEAGDRIFIPKRPLSVRVSGEVLSPAALQFRDGKRPIDYIQEAGGFTYHADKSRAFVLYPDGSAQPLRVNNWNHRAAIIPPGSTIVVPRDPKPFDFMQSAKDISQILSNLAITAIFLDDVRRD
ncbi:MAG: SLBB domain-containing protein [Alphaproteobacteria bacterium]